MREIKFRVWDKDKLKMFPVATVSKYYGIESDDAVDDKGNVHIYRPILMQYTGLKDKNGEEIYEGDICNSVYGIGKVFWNEMTARFSFEFDTDIDGLFEMASGIEGKKFEVIGNVYENGDLLK